MSGPFTGRGKRITGADPTGRTPKFTPGKSWVRIAKGVYRESEQGHGTFAGVETSIVKNQVAYTADENRPHAATRLPGQTVGWIFNLHIGKTWEDIGTGNLNNLAESIMDTVGFAGMLSDEEADKLADLIDSAEAGDEDADPSGYVLDLLVSEGGEKFAGLPLHIEAVDIPNKGNRVYCGCKVSPVTVEELAENYDNVAAAAAK